MGRGGTIFYDKVYTETNPAGSSFDASSGKFIAGVAGVYHISASAERGNTGSSADLEAFLRTSSGNYQDNREHRLMKQLSYGTDTLYTPMTGSRYLSLEEGEEVYLQYTCNSPVDYEGCSIGSRSCVSHSTTRRIESLKTCLFNW